MKFSENRKIIVAIIAIVSCIVIFVIIDKTAGGREIITIAKWHEIQE